MTVVAASLAGCAGYSITHRGTGSGYDVYRPEPYLLVSYLTEKVGQTASDRTVATATIVWLPNYQQPYRVHSWSGLGKADFKFEFADGWRLVSIDDKSENTAVTSQLLEVMKTMMPLRDKPALGLREQSAVPPEMFGLYRFDFDSTGKVSGLTKLSR